jgi:hypothetical protein
MTAETRPCNPVAGRTGEDDTGVVESNRNLWH